MLLKAAFITLYHSLIVWLEVLMFCVILEFHFLVILVDSAGDVYGVQLQHGLILKGINETISVNFTLAPQDCKKSCRILRA